MQISFSNPLAIASGSEKTMEVSSVLSENNNEQLLQEILLLLCLSIHQP